MAANNQVQLILASSSPRRRELLSNLGLTFEIIASNIAEHFDPLLSPAEIVCSLAVQKAAEVANRIRQSAPSQDKQRTLVLGSDTIVVLDGDILGKPQSVEEACNMLCRLSGRCHFVYTGIALVPLNDGQPLVRHAVSRVYMRTLKPAEIEAYAATGEPMDKAGAYALQGIGAALVERVDGCVSNVIGISIPLVVRMLRELNVPILGTT